MPKPNTTLSIDIHGLYVEDALQRVRDFVAKAPNTIEKIIVIHGYNNGTALKEAVRHRLHSPRIQEVSARFGNEGETIIWLKRLNLVSLFNNGNQLFENNKGSLNIWRKDR
ncbi:MAG: Smr/MutS family protein [Bacteroidales bacterium]|nr:Smr/MutS family protein [Bacteroidales bacterium]